MQFATSPEHQRWATGDHQASFGAYLLQVLKPFGGWRMLPRSPANSQTLSHTSSWCNFITISLQFKSNILGLVFPFGSVIALHLQSHLCLPGVGRSRNLTILFPCRGLMPCRVNSRSTSGVCASTERLQLLPQSRPT